MNLWLLLSITFKRVSKLSTLVVLFSAGLVASSSVASSWYYNVNQCVRFFNTPPKRPLILAPFGFNNDPNRGIWDDPQHYEPKFPNSTLNTKDTRNIEQDCSRECFIAAFMGSLESTHANRLDNPKHIQISRAYFMARKFEYFIRETVLNPHNKLYFQRAGGNFYHAMKVMDKYGLITEDIWVPKKALSEWNFNEIDSKLIQELNIVINEKNKYPGKYSHEQLEHLAQTIFQKVLGPYVGNLPYPFYYDGIFHSPESLGKLYGFDKATNIEIKYNNLYGPYHDPNQTSNLPVFINPMLNHAQFNSNHRAEDIQSIFQSVKDALTDGRAVVMEVDGFNTITRQYDRYIGHTFAITDVEVTPSGDIVAVKLKNSYTKWGTGGYAWFHIDAIPPVLRRIWLYGVNRDIPPARLNPN